MLQSLRLRLCACRLRTHFLKSTLLAVAVLGLGNFAESSRAGERFSRDRVLLPFSPAAMVEGPTALRFNPAALGVQRGAALDYYHEYSDSSIHGDDALMLASKHVGFSVQWLGSSGGASDGRAYTIGLSSGSKDGFSVGSTYLWRSSDDGEQNKSHFWSHGVLWRPAGWISLAAVADNHNRMKDAHGNRTDAEFVYSAALSLLEGRLKVGGDWAQATSQRLADGAYRVAASLEMNNGLTVFADIDDDENYFLGGRVNLTNLIVGSHTAFDSDSHYRGGVLHVGFHEERRKPITTIRREVAHLRLSGDIPDRSPPKRLFGSNPATTLDWLNLLERVGSDPSIRAVVLTVDNPHLGWARLDEIRRGLERVRENGKYTVVYLSGQVGNGEYYLATAADLIVVPPVTSVELLGLRAEVTFAKRLLDKIGVTADLEHIGDYKTASDLLTQTEMSPAHREALGQLLDDFDTQLRTDIAVSRQVCIARVAEWIDHGPFVSVDALDEGLVDRVAYADELDDLVREVVGPINARVRQGDLARRVYHRPQWGDPAHVAVVFASGSIMDGSDRSGLMGEVMGAQSVSRAIRQARGDRRVEAIVLRVNSGGGSVFASDAIWHEVQKTAGRKPIVVSFADVAASGGYYIACAADSIFALPNTITGSIGIIGGKADLSGLYDKIGLDKEVETRGRFADLHGSTRSFDDAERALIQDQLQRGYGRFVDLVASGRDLDADSVDALGQGRVWSGTSALSLGLVDRHADLHEVIGVAARMAGVRRGEEIAVDALPKSQWKLFDFDPLGAMAIGPGGVLPAPLRSILTATGLSSGERAAYELPYLITIE